jgi:hypothetical protein
MKSARPNDELLSLFRRSVALWIVMLTLGTSPRRSQAEEYIDTKFMYYQEDDNRIRVLAPTVMTRHEAENGWTITLDGVYNSITGATPVGAPPVRRAPAAVTYARAPTAPGSSTVSSPAPLPSPRHEDDDHEVEGGILLKSKGLSIPASAPILAAVSGATPVATTTPPAAAAPATSGGSSGSASSSSAPATGQSAAPSGSDIPMADFSDQRWAFNLGLSKRFGDHTPSAQFSLSQESDYRSTGISLQDALDLNRKNTTLLYGGALTHDTINPANATAGGSKDTVEGMVGVTQVLTPTTLLTANLTLGEVSGFISDPYKLAEVNGTLIYEKRPDSKTKQVLYLGLNQFITPLDAGIEVGLRHYGDSFGITSETLSLAWFQKLGNAFIVSPSVRYYTQTAADFYDVRFTGNPEFYSSDYRVSAFDAISVGLEFIWMPNSRLTLSAGVDRYQQEGTDGKTDPGMYTSGTLIILGARWNL